MSAAQDRKKQERLRPMKRTITEVFCLLLFLLLLSGTVGAADTRKSGVSRM